MDISVIVLTFNQEGTIARTLDSILCQQTSLKYEIIIGDDASSDGTHIICEKYQKKYPEIIKYIRREKNIGLVSNYFDCLKLSNGELITDCSGDDYWCDPHKLQCQFEVLSQNPDVTLVSGEWVCENSSTKLKTKALNAISPGIYSGKKFLVELFINSISINLGASLYRKKTILELMKNYPDLFRGPNLKFEDLQIIMGCASLGKIFVLPGTVFTYSIGHESVSHKQDLYRQFNYSHSTFNQILDIQKHLLKDLPNQETKKINQFYKNKGDYVAVLAFKTGPSVFDINPSKKLKKIPKGWKGKFYCMIMANNNIWSLMLKVCKLIFPHKFS